MRAFVVALAVFVPALALPQGPWLGGQREILLGPKHHGPLVLGLYVNRKTGTSIGDIVNKTFVEMRLGYMGWKVWDGTFGNKPCRVVETDAFTTVTESLPGYQARSTIKIEKKTYIDPDSGKILRESYMWQDPKGTFRGEAMFGKDEVQIKVEGPGVNRTATVFPEGGTDLLDAMYKPMMVDGKVVMQEKSFTVMNPLTGGVQKVTARVAGNFNWDLSMIKKKGTVIEIKWPDHVQKAYIDEKGELLKVDLPAGRYLLYENIKG